MTLGQVMGCSLKSHVTLRLVVCDTKAGCV